MRPASHQKRARGFTLVELLVVMAIAAIMSTLTVLSFVSVGRQSSREGAAQNVSGILRQARLSAVDSGRGAVVRINPAQRTLYGLARKVIGAWHFEDMIDTDPGPGRDWRTDGSKSMEARPLPDAGSGPPSIQTGQVGLCFEFNFQPTGGPGPGPGPGPGIGTPGDAQYVDCRTYPVFDQTDGVRMEAYVCPAGAGAGEQLGVMAKWDGTDEGYALWLECEDDIGDGAYTAHAIFGIRDGISSDTVELDSDTVTIPGYAWNHVAAEFDGFEARLYVNGVLVDLDSYRDDEDTPTDPDYVPNPTDDPNAATDEEFDPGTRMVPARGESLEIGRYDGGNYFQGRIDEPKLLSVAGGSRVELPKEVPMVISGPEPAIYFDAQGYLDLAHHTAHAWIALGDPYQWAELESDNGNSLDLRLKNPFPPSGGLVMINDEVIDYSGASGLRLTVRYPFMRSGPHSPGDKVYFCRVVRVTQTGIVDRPTHMGM